MTIPSLLAGIERTRIGVTLRAKIEDRIGGIRVITNSNNNAILV